MATAISARDPNTQRNNEEPKRFSLIWLDTSTNGVYQYLDVKKRLRLVIDCIETFKQPDQCENYIQYAREECHHIVVVGDELGHDFIPRIHHLPQVFSIYLYVNDEHQVWKEEYSKVKYIFNQIDNLIDQIIVDRKRCDQIGEPLVFTAFHIYNHIEKSSANINGTFLHAQLLIELLLQLKSTDNNRKEFIDLCRREYEGNLSVIQMIDEFEQDYSDEYALWWYTRETFLYRQLNKALRLQNIEWLFHFRFFIRDIYQLLKQLHDEQQVSSSSNTVYRGQIISSDELRQLNNSMGGLISFISFFSTSRNREHTLFLLGNNPTVCGNLCPILFEIKIDDQQQDTTKPFADITSMSAFADGEQETLFMIGSVFRLQNTSMENDVTIFQMTLCSNDDHDLCTLFEQMKSEIGIGSDDTLLTFGTLLWKSGRFDQAEQFYLRMLEEIQSDDRLVQNCYQGLGLVAAAKGDLQNSLMWQMKVLKHDQETLPSDDYRIGCIQNSIGNIHWRNKNYDLALQSYVEAMKMFGEQHDRALGACLNNIGNVYEEMEQYEKALEYHQKAMNIRESILPPNHSELGTSHHNIANVYRHLNQSDLARSHAKHALKIFQKSLPANDPSIATVYQTMGALEFDCGAYRQGLRYLEQAAGIFRETLPANHPTVDNIHVTIAQAMIAMSESGLTYI